MMTNKSLILILTVFVLLAGLTKAGTEGGNQKLKIYMPREIAIKGSLLTLGQVGIIRGDAILAAAAGQIELGRLSTPDQSIRIDKNVILSRLACSGIPSSSVTLTGAEETLIMREHELISEDRLVAEATAFLKNNLPDPSICQIDPVRTPGQLVLPGRGDNIKLICSLQPHGASNQSKVQVAVFDGNQEVGRQDVYFRFRYEVRKLITKTPILRGDVISTENVVIEKGISNYPEPSGWKVPYGLVALRSIPANIVLTDSMVSAPQPEVLIKRNQTVSIKIENAGLVASAVGKALQDGVAGEYIKVQNVESKIIIMAKVSDDGTVEPVF